LPEYADFEFVDEDADQGPALRPDETSADLLLPLHPEAEPRVLLGLFVLNLPVEADAAIDPPLAYTLLS
jgi:hypothetical protein